MGEAGFCLAVSQRGTPVTAYIAGRTVFAIARPGRDFICTQDAGHAGSHAACDGHGRILARWPRTDAERYWRPGDCEGMTIPQRQPGRGDPWATPPASPGRSPSPRR